MYLICQNNKDDFSNKISSPTPYYSKVGNVIDFLQKFINFAINRTFIFYLSNIKTRSQIYLNYGIDSN